VLGFEGIVKQDPDSSFYSKMMLEDGISEISVLMTKKDTEMIVAMVMEGCVGETIDLELIEKGGHAADRFVEMFSGACGFILIHVCVIFGGLMREAEIEQVVDGNACARNVVVN
jgi:hypothetical protein